MEKTSFQQAILSIRKINTSNGTRFRIEFAPSAAIRTINKALAVFKSETTGNPVEVFRFDDNTKTYSILMAEKFIESMAASLGVELHMLTDNANAATFSCTIHVAKKGDKYTDNRTGEEAEYTSTHARIESPVVNASPAELRALSAAMTQAYANALGESDMFKQRIAGLMNQRVAAAVAMPNVAQEQEPEVEEPIVVVSEDVAEPAAKKDTKKK
jgi:hypothetical protein